MGQIWPYRDICEASGGTRQRTPQQALGYNGEAAADSDSHSQ
jgi:hypothetical protein